MEKCKLAGVALTGVSLLAGEVIVIEEEAREARAPEGVELSGLLPPHPGPHPESPDIARALMGGPLTEVTTSAMTVSVTGPIDRAVWERFLEGGPITAEPLVIYKDWLTRDS